MGTDKDAGPFPEPLAFPHLLDDLGRPQPGLFGQELDPSHQRRMGVEQAVPKALLVITGQGRRAT
jgi:hypothetical protein